MFVAQAHQGLRPSGYLGDGQSSVIQCLAHLLDEGLEERHPRAVAAHHREVRGVAAERREGDVAQDVRCEGLLHEAVAADAAPVADDIAVTVPDQFLNPYECHVATLDSIVLSSTTNLSIIFDRAKHFYNNFTINQQISRSLPAA